MSLKAYPGKNHIVLVEDEDSIRDFMETILSNKGYKILGFSSPKEAIKKLTEKSHAIDLVISDVVMPELHGPQFIKKLKKYYPNIKVLFISGYGEDSFSLEYGEDRKFEFLPKPFTTQEIVSKVKAILSEENGGSERS